MNSYRLICTKGLLDTEGLLNTKCIYISTLQPIMFNGHVSGSAETNDLWANPLKAGLHSALDITFVSGHGSKYNRFYIVEPEAVEELIIQKLQDNPALRSSWVSNTPVRPARIIKLSNSWKDEWMIAEIISQGIDENYCVIQSRINAINSKLGKKTASSFIDKAHKSIQHTRNCVKNLGNQPISSEMFVVLAIGTHINSHVLAQD